MAGIGISPLEIAGRAAGSAGSAGASPAPVTAIAADGWRASYNGTPPAEMDPAGAPESFAVVRPGFDAAGNATTVTDTVTLMKRVRRPYPDQASLTPDDIALSDFIYADDSVAGVTNNSARPYPQPLAMWLTPDYSRADSAAFAVRLAVAHAHVDAAAGDDGTGAVSEDPATAAASPYASMDAAVAALTAYNSANFGRADAGGAVLRLSDGTHAFAGIGAAAGTTSFPLTIEDESRAGTILPDAGGDTYSSIPRHVRFRNLTLRKTGGSLIFLDSNTGDFGGFIHLDGVTVDANGQSIYGGWIYRVGRIVATETEDAGGLIGKTFGTVAKHANLVGCDTAGPTESIYNAAGSRMESFGSKAQVGARVAGSGQVCTHCVMRQPNTGDPAGASSGPIGPRGFAVIGSVFEKYNGDIAAALNFNADGDTGPVQNLLFVGNTVAGARFNYLYQDIGSTEIAKSGYLRFNALWSRNTKTDVFGGDGALTGNWPAAYNVGARSNAMLKGSGKGGGDAHGPGEWLGEVAAPGDVNGSAASPLDPDWSDDASHQGSDLGEGDYTPGAAMALPPVPAGLAPYSHDLSGNALADDGGDRVGAVAAGG